MTESAHAGSLREQFPRAGTVRWMSVRPGRDERVNPVDQVLASVDEGLVGDRFAGPPGADRQVTLIQQEHLDVIAGLLGRESIDQALTRRNIVVSGINLLALKGAEFSIGEAILRGTGSCPPCKKMERNFGSGGFNAMCGHGGITASVVQEGTIRVGDAVRFLRIVTEDSQ